MDDQDTKFLIQEINTKLKKSYNLISFNEMGVNELLRLFCESLNSVQKSDNVKKIADLNESVDQIPEILNNIGYQNSIDNEKNMTEIRKGNKNVIHPILLWIFRNFEKAALRAYLAEYLVRINVPTAYLEMPEIQQAYKTYVVLMDTFRKTHMELQKVEEDSKVVTESESKIDASNKDIAFLNARLTETKDKINKASNSPGGVANVESLWMEYQKEEEMNQQMEEQQLTIEQLDTEYSQLQQNLQMIQSAKQNATNPLAHIKEELKQNENRLNKLTQLVETAQKKIDRLRQVVNVQTVMEDDLNDWRERIDELQIELQELEEKKKQQIDPLSDRLAPYKKELSAIGDTQSKMTLTLNRTKMALQVAEKTMKEKQAAVDKIIGHEVKRGTELKAFIQQLREKNQLVDYYKEIIAGMKTEHEVQLRTMEILSQKHPDLKGIFDKRNTKQTVKAIEVVDPKTNSVMEVLQLCKQTKMQVDSSKAQLSAFTQEITPLREVVRNDHQRLMELQKNFEDQVGGLKHQLDIANREVERLKTELKQKEDQWKTLQREIQYKEDTLETIEAETNMKGADMNSEVSSTQQATLEAQLKTLEVEIQDLERIKKNLESTQVERENICKSWNTAKKILEIKKRNREANNKKVQKIGRTEILTL